MTRSEKSARLRAALSRFKGGTFTVSSSGGANGMLFFRDAQGREWFMGGIHNGDAEPIVEALNLVLELLATPAETRRP